MVVRSPNDDPAPFFLACVEGFKGESIKVLWYTQSLKSQVPFGMGKFEPELRRPGIYTFVINFSNIIMKCSVYFFFSAIYNNAQICVKRRRWSITTIK